MDYSADENIYINISEWEPDHEYDGIYPIGARDKAVYFSPSDVTYNYLKPKFRYLFKESNPRYPWQFFIEVIAYRIGRLVNIPVPEAFLATDGNACGTLIQWFYDENDPQFRMYVPGGDFLSNIIDNFDNKTGRQHNLWHFELIVDVFAKGDRYILEGSPLAQFLRMLVFDALIGNTDRHQENWGYCLYDEDKGKLKVRLTPAFDNGTSFGHEILEKKITTKFHSDDALKKYILKGKHHIRWKMDEAKAGHIEFIERMTELSPAFGDHVKSILDFDLNDIQTILEDVAKINGPIQLSPVRVEFMLRLITTRRKLMLKSLG